MDNPEGSLVAPGEVPEGIPVVPEEVVGGIRLVVEGERSHLVEEEAFEFGKWKDLVDIRPVVLEEAVEGILVVLVVPEEAVEGIAAVGAVVGILLAAGEGIVAAEEARKCSRATAAFVVVVEASFVVVVVVVDILEVVVS